ncbi:MULTISPECIES: response regulator transcription factor [Sphingomonas]|uniref:response regulator transcription factor n=1 Tax=Sphingomonas TaxID=13687 RepID=UPI002FF2C346
MIVDDHPVLRIGISTIIEGQEDMKLVGEATNGAEALEQFRALRPDVTLMDLQMPRMSGVDAITAIRAESENARIIVLTTYAGDAQAMRALKAGAVGYLLKSTVRKDLLDTIRAVHAGRRHIPPEIAQEIAFHAADETLSEREIAVLSNVAAGKANKEIAWALAISEDTVKAHMRSIFAKLDVGDRTQAVTAALRRGIIEL